MYDKTETIQAAQGCGPNLRTADLHAEPLRQQVFEHVRAAGRAARADVTRALGISPGSVTTITADLIATGLLREVEGLPRETGRGRPPVALEVIPESRYVIGIKLSDERHTAVLTDFAGNICADVTLSTPNVRKSLGAVLDEVSALMDSLIAKSGMTFDNISAVGIGVSGMVENQTGTIAWSPLLIHKDVPFGEAFTRRFNMPVYLDNDANLLTLAELWFGAGREMSDFVVVTVEHGVGMGLVLNNRLFRGSRGMGMELGHTKVQLDGALCRCGQRGCLEAYLADYALAREAATALDQAHEQSLSPHQLLEGLFTRAKEGNQAAQTIFRRAGRYLSVGLANIVQLFDPDLIILAGERMQYDYLYEDEVIREMESLTLLEGRRPPRIVTHAWGDFVWARGATALALSALTDATLGA